MPEDGPDQRRIDVYRPPGVLVERRRTMLSPASVDGAEKPPDLVAFWRIIRKRSWIVWTIFCVLFGVVLIATLRQKPVYRAKALLEIDRENPSLVTPQELFQLDEVSDAYLETQYKVLNSDDLAERVIDELGLEKVAEFRPPQNSWAGSNAIRAALSAIGLEKGRNGRDHTLRETALARFHDRLDINPIRHSRAVEISFDAQNPALAARVVNTLTADYAQKNLEARWDATQKASEWMSQQLSDMKTKLEHSENDLQKYAADNGLLIIETSNGNSESIMNQDLRELQQELTQAQDARYKKESLYRIAQAGDPGALPGVFDDKLLQDLSIRLAELQRQRAQLATTFTDGYPRVMQVQSQIAEIRASLGRERRRAVQKISDDYFASVKQEELLQRAFEKKQNQANAIAEKTVQYGIRSRDVDSNKSMYDGLLQQLKQAGVSAGLKASNIRVVDPGKASYNPVAPNVPLNLGLAAILGLGLGICAALLLEHLDQTVRGAEDVDHFLRVPALALIPSFESLRRDSNSGVARKGRAYSLRFTDPKVTGRRSLIISRQSHEPDVFDSPILSEAFRGLRTSVLLPSASRSAHSVLVTSAQAGEGRTLIATKLAVSLAQLGRRVLLVDADLRRPGIHKHFPQNGSQLSGYLQGRGTWQEMVRQTAVSGLDVLLSGDIPSNPAELVSSEGMRKLIQEASKAYDLVVLDSPPLLNVVDSRILASMVEATVLVVKCGETPRQVVRHAESQARAAGANLLGVVLNHLDVRFTDYSHYAYDVPEDAPLHAS